MVSISDQDFFKHSPVPHRRLVSLGFEQHFPKINMYIYISGQERSSLMHTLLSLKGRYTPSMANLAQEGILSGTASKISLRGAFKLHNRSVISKSTDFVGFVGSVPSVVRPEQHSVPSKDDANIFFQNFSLVCPRCKQPRGNSHIWPRSGARWVDIACTTSCCTFIAPAHQWRCNCDISWQACKTHARWPEMCAAHLPAADTKRYIHPRPRPSIPSGTFNILQHVSKKATSASGSKPPPTQCGPVRIPGRQRGSTGVRGRRENPGAVVTKELSRTTILPPSHFIARALTPRLAAKFPRLCKDLPLGEDPHST